MTGGVCSEAERVLSEVTLLPQTIQKEKFFDPRKPFQSQRPETHEEWQARMGGEVLAVVRSGLYLDFRFLDMALSALNPAPDERCRVLATDGQTLYYQPQRLLQLYQENPKYLNRLYLHTIFHCVFRHLWLKGRREPQLWSLACDIAVENVIDSLQRKSVMRPLTYVRQNAYRQITAEEKVVAAAPAYRWLTRQTPGVLRQLEREFSCRLTLRDLLQAPTVAAQAALVDHRAPGASAGELVCLHDADGPAASKQQIDGQTEDGKQQNQNDPRNLIRGVDMQPIYTQRNQKCQYRRAYLNGGGVVVQLEGKPEDPKNLQKYADARQQHPADAVGDGLAFFLGGVFHVWPLLCRVRPGCVDFLSSIAQNLAVYHTFAPEFAVCSQRSVPVAGQGRGDTENAK